MSHGQFQFKAGSPKPEKLGPGTNVKLGVVVVVGVAICSTLIWAATSFERMRLAINDMVTVSDMQTYSARLEKNNANLKLEAPDIGAIVKDRLDRQRPGN